VILAWDPEALPADWEAGRQRYFTINWIQLATTWAAFALFLLALISLYAIPNSMALSNPARACAERGRR
jgi:hypothetical protein